MRYDRTTQPDVFADRLVALSKAGRIVASPECKGGVTVTERVLDTRWLVCATVSLGDHHVMLLEATVGCYLTSDLPGVAADEAWPTHAAALTQVREVVALVEAAANDAGLVCAVTLDVSRRVLAERPTEADTPTPTSGGRRLGAALAWTKRRAA